MSPPRAVVALAALAVVLVAACGSDQADTRSETAGLFDLGQELGAREWVLDPADSSLTRTSRTEDDPGPITLRFEDDAVSGSAACNLYRGSLDVEGDDTVAISDIVQTQRACTESSMDLDDEYLAALEVVRDVDLDDEDRLVLSDGGRVRLAFDGYDAEMR
jgi:heat shock protein HslJ